MIAALLRSFGRKAAGYGLLAFVIVVIAAWMEHLRAKVARAEVELRREQRRAMEEDVKRTGAMTVETAARVHEAEAKVWVREDALAAAREARAKVRAKVDALLLPADLDARADRLGV